MTVGCTDAGGPAGISFLRHLSLLSQLPRLGKLGCRARKSGFRSEVEEQIEGRIASGTARIGPVARELGYSRQTLYRRLKAEGVTFEELCDLARRRLAIRYVRDGVPLKEAAYRLGFSDPSAFSRAFKRWTGLPPSEF